MDLKRVLEAYQELESLSKQDEEIFTRIHSIKDQTDYGFLAQEVSNLVELSQDDIGRINQIMDELKAFSKADDSGWQHMDLHRVLDSAVNFVACSMAGDQVEMIKEYGDLPDVQCLPLKLYQLVTSLLLNAVQAIEGKGVITVRTGAEGDSVWFEVGDTGVGITPENLSHIFDPFYTTKQGTGMGLTVCCGIVNQHGGRIMVQSRPGGTTFRVRLPISQPGKPGEEDSRGIDTEQGQS